MTMKSDYSCIILLLIYCWYSNRQKVYNIVERISRRSHSFRHEYTNPTRNILSVINCFIPEGVQGALTSFNPDKKRLAPHRLRITVHRH